MSAETPRVTCSRGGGRRQDNASDTLGERSIEKGGRYRRDITQAL